jgi:hypothetical protein
LLWWLLESETETQVEFDPANWSELMAARYADAISPHLVLVRSGGRRAGSASRHLAHSSGSYDKLKR